MSTGHGITCDCGQQFATVAGLRQHLQERTPDTLYAIVDPSVPEGQSVADGCENIFGVPYLVEEFNGDAECEHCRKEGAYHLEHDVYGVAFCRYHLEQQPGVAAVVESQDDIKQFEIPEAPIRTGGQ